MHQPHTEPRASIYYRYRVHPQAPRPDAPPRVPVLVVGAGPVGLTTALLLARQGVPCTVLEAERQVSEGSRAIVFTRRSLEILQSAGAHAEVVRHGLPWRFGNSFYRGQRVYRMEAPHGDDERFFPMTNLQQQYLEEYLLDALAREPLATLRWGHKVLGAVENTAQGVTLEIDTPEGPYRQAADWVVATDGARSGLRSSLGLKLEGAAYEGQFVIADIRCDLPLPTERLAFFDPPWNPGNTVLMHREPHGLWRIDYRLPDGETPEQALRPEALRARIDAQLASIGHAGIAWALDWSSVYAARAMTLPEYVHGRIVFAGDAAHLLPIFGVRGANTGFQDAQNLAWKLALVQQGVAGPGLLASYSTERVAAAREIVAEAGKSTRFMTPPTRGFRLLRDAVLSLSLSEPFVGPLYHWRTSRPHDYTASPLNDAVDDRALFATGPAPGAPVPNLRLADDEFLLDHLTDGAFVLLVHGTVADDVQAAAQRWRERGVPLRVMPVTAATARHLGLDTPGAACLVRPDQHVCARWRALAPDRLDAALRTALALTAGEPR